MADPLTMDEADKGIVDWPLLIRKAGSGSGAERVFAVIKAVAFVKEALDQLGIPARDGKVKEALEKALPKFAEKARWANAVRASTAHESQAIPGQETATATVAAFLEIWLGLLDARRSKPGGKANSVDARIKGGDTGGPAAVALAEASAIRCAQRDCSGRVVRCSGCRSWVCEEHAEYPYRSFEREGPLASLVDHVHCLGCQANWSRYHHDALLRTIHDDHPDIWRRLFGDIRL